MKILATIVNLLLVLNSSNAQDTNAFKNLNNQYIFNSFVYEDVWNLKEDRWPVAKISNPEKFGYIDNEGKIVINFRYDYAGKFSNGLALVKIDNKYGYINKNGKKIIAFKYDDASPFINGIANVAKYKKSKLGKVLVWSYINEKGRKVK